MHSAIVATSAKQTKIGHSWQPLVATSLHSVPYSPGPQETLASNISKHQFHHYVYIIDNSLGGLHCEELLDIVYN
jgi:hypothetical protein